MQVVAQRTRHGHGAALGKVMELAMASLLSNLPPPSASSSRIISLTFTRPNGRGPARVD